MQVMILLESSSSAFHHGGRIPVIDNIESKDLFWIKVPVRGCLAPMPWASGEAENHIYVAIRDASRGGGRGEIRDKMQSLRTCSQFSSD